MDEATFSQFRHRILQHSADGGAVVLGDRLFQLQTTRKVAIGGSFGSRHDASVPPPPSLFACERDLVQPLAAASRRDDVDIDAGLRPRADHRSAFDNLDQLALSRT
jgi:hypothetical protein